MIHKTKVNCFLRAEIIFFFLCFALLTSCSAPEKRLEKERLTLVYRPQSALGSEVKKLRLKHPIKILNEQTVNHLLSLHYEELSLLGKKKYIFSSNDVLEIAPLITKALNWMKADKVLHYEVDTPRGTTAGTIFRANGKINWRFEAINGINFSNSSFPEFRGSSWRLLPKNGQTFSKSHSILGNEQQENWIVSNLDLPAKSKRSLKSGSLKKIPRSTSPSSLERKESKNSPANQKKIKKRLQFLKDLRDKQLINNDEYEHKKKELLDQFL